jgi:threonine dehydratase
VFLKIETLQPTFSYKIRGAFNAVLTLAEHGPDVPPLVTASAGNHGRALAYAAAVAGLPLTVYLPETAPRIKVDAIRRTGAELRTCASYDEAERRAKEHAAGGRALYVSPYSDPHVITGAGTVGLEILDEDAAIDTIIVAIGGGGLISGIALAAEGVAGARTRVVGVEAEASTPFTHSLAAGRIVQVDVQPTLADGLAGNLDPETVTFDLVRRLVRTIVVVNEQHLRDAVRGLAIEEKIVVEGAGAAAVAAVVAGRCDVRGTRTAIVVSGANIDADTFKRCL